MKINFIDTNTSSRAMGGTELVAEGITKHVDPSLLEQFNIIHTRVGELDSTRKNIFICHETPFDGQVQHLKEGKSRDRFAGIVMVSHWQAQLFNLVLGVPFKKMTVIQNAITPFPNVQKATDGNIRLTYISTPNRGLALLVPVFERVCDYMDDVELDVYSSFKLYGWEQNDAPYRELFDRCRKHPKINYHGSVSNEVVREALCRSDILAYPNIYMETSCLSVIEAMAAKNIVVCSNYGALPETCANWAIMYGMSEDHQEHCQRFADHLVIAIDNVRRLRNDPKSDRRIAQGGYFNTFYGWETRALQWNDYLRGLL
jgi:UDP-glucose:(glucosyl)LPS alpha-1,2-glucosyltransferase